MTTYYVEPTYGNDSNAGTIGAPWQTWTRLKTFLEGSPSADTVILLDDITVTATITPAGSFTLRGPSWHIRPTITGLANTNALQLTSRSSVYLQNLVVSGGSNFVKFSGTCSDCYVEHCKGVSWAHSTDSSATQFIEAGGGSRTNCYVRYCEGSTSSYDFFSTAGSYGWVIERNYIHDIGDDDEAGNTDAIAFHDSSAGFSTVRYNYIANIAGKAGIQLGTNASVGSKGYVYGNFVKNCRRGITVDGSAPDAYVYNNVVVMGTGVAASEPSSYGIGSLCGDSASGMIRSYGNVVYCQSAAGEIYCFRYDTVFAHVNNIAVVANSTARYWYISAGSTGYANVLNYNLYYSTDGTQGTRFRLGAGLVTLAGVQSVGGEPSSYFADPRLIASPPTFLAEGGTRQGSPGHGVGFDLSAVFTTDAGGRAITAPYSIGPWFGKVNEWDEHSIAVQVVEDEISCQV